LTCDWYNARIFPLAPSAATTRNLPKTAGERKAKTG
jgi:hypothetical protein